MNGGIRTEEVINLLLADGERKVANNHSTFLKVNAIGRNGGHTNGKITLDGVNVLHNLHE